MCPICLNLRRNPTNWKNQNTPSLKQKTSHITLAGLHLFQSTQSSKHGIKPCEIIPIITDYLKISKKEALSNPVKARSLFYEYRNKFNIDNIDDRSLNRRIAKKRNTEYDLCSSPPLLGYRRSRKPGSRNFNLHNRSFRKHLHRLQISLEST